MSREILFRGKRVDDGEWIYGLPAYYETNKNEKGVITGIEYDPGSVDKIIPETVSQFTGLLNSKQVKIFEGDVLVNEKGDEGVVVWNRERARFMLHAENKKGVEQWFALESKFCWYKNVIGNIHEL